MGSGHGGATRADLDRAAGADRGAATGVHIVLPNDIDDPATPSGGNAYDRRICTGLVASGWSVREHPIRGGWPHPRPRDRTDLARVLGSVPDNAVVLLDGLIASAVPEVLLAHSRRLRLVVLLHASLGDDAEGAALAAARAVITTSAWTGRRIRETHGLPAGRVHVATPGVDLAPVGPGSGTGSRLLCVAAVTPQKGHDILVEALAELADRTWSCVCVGSLSRDPAFVDRLHRQARADGIADRIRFVGPRGSGELDAAYAATDLLVLPSRGETYGMVVTEALARGIPVLATAVGGLPEALGSAADGSLPGILVRPDDPGVLAGSLRRWLGEPDLRERLGRSARDRRATLTGWAVTAERVSSVLLGVAA